MSKTILIVDDEPEFLKMVKMRLDANGYTVLTASDGQTGVAKAKQLVPDLILIDIMMPNMSGGDVVHLLKADLKTANIPVIFITAVLGRVEEEQNQQINVNNKFYPAISKPFDPEKFLKKIQEALLNK
jgi:CheY-like chemotaxis protein